MKKVMLKPLNVDSYWVFCHHLFADVSMKSLQVVALSGMMTSPPPRLLSCPRRTTTSPQSLCPRLPSLVFPLRHPQSDACWSPAGPAPQTTLVFPYLRPASPASRSHISRTLTSSKEASLAYSYFKMSISHKEIVQLFGKNAQLSIAYLQSRDCDDETGAGRLAVSRGEESLCRCFYKWKI